MKLEIKKAKEYEYNFDMNEELRVYSGIGQKNSPYQNYCEWYNYVCGKYGGGKYTEKSLKNFVHYLKREKNIITSSKEIWNGCVIPLLTVLIAIVYTFVFSAVNVINTYNNSINTLVDDEFLKYTGYSAELIYKALEQDLYSGMWFYLWGTVITVLTALMFLCFASYKIRSINLKNEFYLDYIMIIQKMAQESTSTLPTQMESKDT